MSRRHAFTLLELLMAIAIIGILATLLFPAFVRAKAQANRTTCINNLKQINMGTLMYAHDNADVLPALPRPNPYPNSASFFFKELVKKYAGLSSPPTNRDQLFICPAEVSSPSDGTPSTAYVVDFSDYFFNGGTVGAKLSSVIQPTRTVLVTEYSALVGYSFHHPQACTFRVNNPPQAGPSLHFAFADALNETSFVDGHINYIKIYCDGISMAGLYNPPASYDYQWSVN